jgi:hypothetical protein
MPEIIPLGWFHTAMGVIALVSGGFTLTRYREISLETRSGAIYQRGEFGPGHALAVMTLLALAVGTIAAITTLFGRLSRYVRALGYSSTLLFHCVPAVTDGLMRLPVGDPVVTSIGDPLLRICYLVLLVLALAGISLQLRWIHRHSA